MPVTGSRSATCTNDGSKWVSVRPDASPSLQSRPPSVLSVTLPPYTLPDQLDVSSRGRLEGCLVIEIRIYPGPGTLCPPELLRIALEAWHPARECVCVVVDTDDDAVVANVCA